MSDDRPLARADGLVVEQVEDELLIFDIEHNHAHVLNSPAATVWQMCDGSRSLADIQQESGLSEDAVRLAVAQLQERSLLAESVAAGFSRRAVLRSGAVAGAGLGLGLPVIRSIVAPTPAMAASGGGPGSTGPTGPQGMQGMQGFQGMQGMQGFQGFQGMQGMQGTTGF